MANYGFVRVAAATPSVKVADCDYNTEEIIKLIAEAEKQQVSVIVFPELSITAYTCADLFHQRLLLDGVARSIVKINQSLENKTVTAIVGMPLFINGSLYNVAAVLSGGKIQGFVPKTYLPNYSEFYEKRWFASSSELSVKTVSYLGQEIPVGIDLIFETPTLKFGIEICEDLWTPVPPSSLLALNGAEVIFNLSASNETVGKNVYRKSLISQQSARCIAGYVYAAAGSGESTTDIVFSGSSLIAENGSFLAESKRFELSSQLVTADIDIERLQKDRISNSSFTTNEQGLSSKEYRTIELATEIHQLNKLDRYVSPTPFVPVNDETLDERCGEIFSIQVGGLAKRLLHTNCKTAVIGVSGGLDSTLALLVLVRAFDKLDILRKNIYGITMPGFGTTDRTYTNAIELMKSLGVTTKEISINKSVLQHFEDIDHDINLHDVTYENSQARERTQILMDYANKVNGLVIGTGDLSELALGWCTYNGDHMSMYAVNTGVPKTLVRTLVKWVSDTQMDSQSKAILNDVIDTPVSPELLPAGADGEIAQITEHVVGPYILHDFFLYYVLRFGFSPAKIYFLAQHAFDGEYSKSEMLKWLNVFFHRFFSQQFKRSCLPDGPKVGSVNLSPRGDWRMPSDASSALWMKELDTLS
ncbi:NAD(+) synthase [Dysgonomonas sp. ZJ279]|uniref:NAD(+) synthase n=1 Tax=Dysgonomonas sp. ZJ279 TaxID=2709796 RepID=UPI0013EBB64F|nr:NAD(+) synthase [Dysgonomonas sp. ZJ279]